MTATVACEDTTHVSENESNCSPHSICPDTSGLQRTHQSDENNLLKDILLLSRTPILSRVPKGARSEAARTLSFLINNACESDFPTEWRKLFRFSYFCLSKPKRGGKHRPSLASVVKNNIQKFLSDPLATIIPAEGASSRLPDADDNRAKLVGKKIANGDIKGAIRVLSSNDTILPQSPNTLATLQSKHPSRHPDSQMPEPPDATSVSALQLNMDQIRKAILSFPGGSAGGYDLLLPQHLKDLISKASGDNGMHLLVAITRLCNKMLKGEIPRAILPILYGAKLIAFSKPNGGVRPIAIGNTLRRLTAKAAAFHVQAEVKSKLFPFQLGVAISGGAEAIVHTVRSFCNSKLISPEPVAILKIDFENAFNTIRRDSFLGSIKEYLPEIYPFLFQCYRDPSVLTFNDIVINSDEGIQQGDPLGPICFSLCIQRLISRLSSALNVWYLDDGTLAGDPQSVLSDFETILSVQSSFGLKINVKKCELSVLGSDSTRSEAVASSFLSQHSDLKMVDNVDLNILGVPLFPNGINEELSSRLNALKLAYSRLEKLDHHDALFLLKNVFFLPKLLYLLRTFPCHGINLIKDLDLCMMTCLEKITNCRYNPNTFRQATLPVKLGGLGVRRSEDICLPAFIASSSKCASIVEKLLSTQDSTYFNFLLSDAVHSWKDLDSRLIVPANPASLRQKSWDLPVANLVLQDLIDQAPDPTSRSRLMAVSAPYAGVWLNAVPIPSLGLKLDNESLRISVALRLGVQITMPYTCVCGKPVQGTATHGLDCRKSSGKHARHSEVNNIIKRALTAAGVPSQLEPAGLSRDDGKRPDGATIIPWSQGKCAVWDFTCVNTVAASHIASASTRACAPCEGAENKKRSKYSSLSNVYDFNPVAVETMGPWGPNACVFINEIGKRLANVTGDPRSTAFLRQRIGMAVQWGNAVCVKESLPFGADFNEAFYI